MSRATREAYGQTLVELVNEGHDIVAVDADLAGSTKLADLQKAFPQRMVDVGIAEQNMVGVASGLSLTGRTVFTGSFAVFATGRAYDQIRNTVCDSGLNVKICPTHAGITVGEDGATHQSLEDIGMMRALPQMRVLVPADYNATKAALRLAAEADGPFYVRMGRHKVADIYDESFKGGLPFANVLREGTDVTIAACGVEVAQALAAADLLAEEKISAEVIDVFSVKPLDEEVILASAEKTRHVVTVEEHNVATGLGAAVAELLAEQLPTPMRFAGMRTFGTSAPGDVLLSHFGLDAEGIAARVREFLLSWPRASAATPQVSIACERNDGNAAGQRLVRVARRFQPGIYFVWIPGFLCGNAGSGPGFSPGERRKLGVSAVRGGHALGFWRQLIQNRDKYVLSDPCKHAL